MENLEVNFILLNKLRKDQEKTFAGMEKSTGVPEATIKNVLLGKTKRPGADTLRKICDDLGIPVEDAFLSDGTEQLKVQLETQAIKEGNVTVVALKEIYEQQVANLNIINETHINNIRSHYQQHHEDLKENYEKRLADKREVNELQKEQIKDLKRANFIESMIIALLATIFVILFIMELMHPEHGWLKY